MKSRNITLLVTLVIFLLLGTVLLKMPQFTVTNRSNEPIPYIYYYSDLHQAWVIERADGSDSRLLGQGQTSHQYIAIDSVHWSPSGEWLAWRGHEQSEGGGYPVHGGLVSSAGEPMNHLLEGADNIFFMEWSPDKDWLVLGFEGDYPHYSQKIRLIDVPNQRIVSEFTQNFVESPQSWGRRPRVWAEDGNSLYFVFSPTEGTLLTRLETNGQLENWVFNEQHDLMDFHRERLMKYRLQRLENSWQHEWFITDLSTGQEYLFASDSNDDAPAHLDYDISWNEDGTYAIVIEKECIHTTTYVCQTVIGRYLLDWNGLRHYPLSSSFQLAINTNYRSYDVSGWSPNGRYALLEDFSLNLFLLDAETREIFELGLDKNRDWFWMENDDLVLWGGQDGKIFHFSVEDWQVHEISYYPAPYPQVNSVSSDASMIGFQSFGVIVKNLISGEVYTFPAHGHGAPVMDYLWGENSEWFFSGSNTVVAGGGADSRAIILHQLHEATGRELSLCYNLDPCAGFLPERVLPHLSRGQAESFTPAPEHTLLHDKPLYGLGWSPDGRRLASFSSNSEEGTSIRIWNMQATEPYLETSYETDLQCNNHPAPCEIFWESNSEFYYEAEQRVLHNSGYYMNISYIESYNLAENTLERSEGEIPHDWDSPVSGDYRLEFSGEPDNTALLYHQPTETLVSPNPLERILSHSFFAFDYHPETNLLVSPNIYRRGALWDVATGEQIAQLNWTGYAAAFSPDGRLLAVGSSEFVTIWDMSAYIDNR